MLPEVQFSRESSAPTAAELDDEFDISVVRSAQPSTRGIDEQTIGRTLMDLERVAPKLSRLAPLLEPLHLDRTKKDDIGRFLDVWMLMRPMFSQVSRLLTEVGALPENVEPEDQVPLAAVARRPATPPPPSTRPSKRAKRASAPILGPSHEKAQKHKESYGHH